MSNEVLEFASDLIARKSITPADGDCQQVIGERLQAVDFDLEPMIFDDVTNLWAVRGNSAPLFVFAGHTDVVPTGDLERWNTDPFEPVVKDGFLFGRGAADMKTSVAAMVIAAERFVKQHPNHRGSIAFLITSDEEGDAVNGTTKVVDTLQARGVHMDCCVVGEPTSDTKLADTIRVGRRGSLSCKLTVTGSLGHVAYPEKTPNAVHEILPSLASLSSREWDQGNEFFRSTTFQISNVNAGTGAANVIPSEVVIQFNFRYNTEQSAEGLQKEVERVVGEPKEGISLDFDWRASGLPFLSKQGKFTDAVCEAARKVTGLEPVRSTAGGTSDARFIVPTGTETVELGPVNSSIHKFNEHVRVDDLEPLCEIYYRTLATTLT